MHTLVKKFQINNLSSHLKNLQKGEQKKLKANRRKEISAIENRKIKSMKPKKKKRFFENVKKIEKR